MSAPLGALWFGIFGAALAWSLQELVAYAAVARVCSTGWTVALVVSVVATTVGTAAALTASRSWRRTRLGHLDEEEHQLEVGEGRSRFMALAGVVMSGIFLFNILMNTAVLFLVPVCG